MLYIEREKKKMANDDYKRNVNLDPTLIVKKAHLKKALDDVLVR